MNEPNGQGAPGGSAARPIRLSATVIAQDEEARLADCLASLRFCDEVLVVDGGSRDRTREIARACGARLVERPFDDFARQHQFATDSARGRWVLSLDADERASPQLAAEVRAIADAAPDALAQLAFTIPFQNHFRGVRLRHGGLAPDRHLRLYLREKVRFDPARGVHEKILLDGEPASRSAARIGRIEGAVLHFGWVSLSQALAKSERYAEAAAQALHASGKRGSLVRMFGKPLWRFLRGYLLQLGFLDGAAGALVALLRAHEALSREARLWELSRFGSAAEQDRLR